MDKLRDLCLLIPALALLCLSCARTETEISMQALVPAGSALTVRCDLGAWLRGSGCQGHEGAMILTKPLGRALDRLGGDARPLVAAVAEWGCYADLGEVFFTRLESTSPLYALARIKPGRDLPDTLESEECQVYNLGAVSFYPLGDGVSTARAGDCLWLAVADTGEMAEGMDMLMSRAESHSVASTPALEAFFATPSPMLGCLSVDDFDNPLGDDFSRVLFDLSFADTSLSATLTFADSGLKPVSPFKAMSEISPGLFAMMPANSTVTAAIGLGGDVRMGEIIDLACRRLSASAALGLRLAYNSIAPVHGQFTVGAAPGGSAETIRRLSLSSWLVKAIVPVDEDRLGPVARIIDSFVPGNVDVYGYGDYTILQNYDDADYPEAGTTPAVRPGQRLLATAEVPYKGEVMKGLGLSHGFSATVSADASRVDARLRLLGPGFILSALVSDF